MGVISDVKGKLSDVYEQVEASPSVQKALNEYSSWRNATSNIFGADAQKKISESNLIPDAIKDKYLNLNGLVQTATDGLAGASITTAALRYQKPINAAISFGVRTVADAGSYVNDKIDDVVDDMRKQRGNEFNFDEKDIDDMAYVKC